MTRKFENGATIYNQSRQKYGTYIGLHPHISGQIVVMTEDGLDIWLHNNVISKAEHEQESLYKLAYKFYTIDNDICEELAIASASRTYNWDRLPENIKQYYCKMVKATGYKG